MGHLNDKKKEEKDVKGWARLCQVQLNKIESWEVGRGEVR